MLLHVDHRRTIVHIRGDEIRVLPHVCISVGINEWNGGFSRDDSEMATEVLRRGVERCLPG